MNESVSTWLFYLLPVFLAMAGGMAAMANPWKRSFGKGWLWGFLFLVWWSSPARLPSQSKRIGACASTTETDGSVVRQVSRDIRRRSARLVGERFRLHELCDFALKVCLGCVALGLRQIP
jgi:hypothetical protein